MSKRKPLLVLFTVFLAIATSASNNIPVGVDRFANVYVMGPLETLLLCYVTICYVIMMLYRKYSHSK